MIRHFFGRFPPAHAAPDGPRPESATLSVRELGVALRALPFTQLANAFNALLLAYWLTPAVPSRAGLWAWTVAAAGLGCGWWWTGRRWLADPSRLASPMAATRIMVLPSLLSGMLHAALLVWLLPVLDADRRFLLAMVHCGMICADAFAFATVPRAAYAFTLTMCLGGSVALWRTGSGTLRLTIGLLWMYGAITAWMVRTMSGNLRARMRSEAEAAERSELVGMLLRDFESHASDWLWECDPAGVLRRGSARMANALGRPGRPLEGLSWFDLLDPGHTGAAELAQRLRERVAFASLQVALRVRSEAAGPAGTALRWWSLTAAPVLGAAGEVVGWRGVGSDVTAARHQADELERAALIDPLTGLANRRSFMQRLQAVEATLAPQERPEAVLQSLAEGGQEAVQGVVYLIDVDNFKSVNDTLGHPMGDRLLQAVASRLSTCLAPGGWLARLGGDEFAVLQPLPASAAGAQQAEAGGRRLLEAMHAPCQIEEVRLEVRLSVGGALYPLHGSTSTDLMRHADAALYAAKDAGRDTVRLFDRALAEAAARRHHVLNDLRSVLERDELSLAFQPQVAFDDGRLCGFEALLRWQHPQRGAIAPGDFIPVAEDTGMIVPIGAWVLRQACEAAARWPRDLHVAVNLSPVQFNSRSLLTVVDEALAVSGLAPGRLELEITESALLADRREVRETLEALRSRGVRIALDDFGTGYSSLAYLQAFPLDVLKIDRAFVSRLSSAATDGAGAIVRAITVLARSLGLVTVAEGVETEAEVQQLRALGCDLGQGWHFGRPAPGPEIESLLVQHRIRSAERMIIED